MTDPRYVYQANSDAYQRGSGNSVYAPSSSSTMRSPPLQTSGQRTLSLSSTYYSSSPSSASSDDSEYVNSPSSSPIARSPLSTYASADLPSRSSSSSTLVQDPPYQQSSSLASRSSITLHHQHQHQRYHHHPPRPSQPPKQQHDPQQPCQYICLFARCNYSASRKADLERHIRSTHTRETVQLVDCAVTGCHRVGMYGFSRKDKLVEHMREVHKVDIPKRSGGRKTSVWC